VGGPCVIPGGLICRCFKVSVSHYIGKYFGLTFASSPPKPPKFKPLLWPCKLDGGRPPLAGGCGIGEGDVDGEVMRGFVGVFTANELDDWFG